MSRIAFILATTVSFMAAPAFADDFTTGSLKIIHPWARATPKGSNVGGGYMTIINNGSTPDRLIGGSSDVAKSLEVHLMRMQNGVMTMREQTTGLEIKPGKTVELKPSGFHLMFVGLHKQLSQGERVNATLKFEKAGTVNVYFDVGPIGARRPANGGTETMSGMGDQHMGDHQKK